MHSVHWLQLPKLRPRTNAVSEIHNRFLEVNIRAIQLINGFHLRLSQWFVRGAYGQDTLPQTA